MKHISRFLALVMALLMLCGVALAELQLYCPMLEVTDEGRMEAVIYTSKTETLGTDDVKVLFDATEAAPTSVKVYERSEMGTTWIYVVDLSTADRDDEIKSLLKTLISNLGEFDNALVYTTAMESGEMALTQDKAKLEAAVDGIERNRKLPALNSKVSEALAFVNGNSDARERTAIVVVSNGQNADTTITQDELLKKVGQSDAAIYTVAMEAKSNKEDKLNAYASIARASKGGLAINVPYREADMSQFFAQINANEKLFRVLEMDPVAANIVPGEVSIGVKDGSFEQTVTVALTAVEKDRINQQLEKLAAEAEAAAEPELSPEPEPTVEAEPETSEEPAPTGEAPVIGQASEPAPFTFTTETILLIAMGGVLVVLLVVLVVVFTKKKSKPAVDLHPISEEPNATMPVDDGGRTAAVPTPKGIRVILEQVGVNENQRYVADMLDTLIVGHSATKARIVLPDDKVSRAHLRLSYMNGVMYAEDLNSLNGTKLNGMAMTGKVVLHQQDVLTMGTTNLRISWNG